MEGRGLSELYRNSSEELFLKSWMENSIGISTPTMEMMGFKNLSQNFRTDSEELFKSWLTNGENCNNSSGLAHRTRQASRRISTELVDLSSPQNVGKHQKRISNNIIHPQNVSVADDISGVNQHAFRNVAESEVQGCDLYLAKAWFHCSQPMTRSRSSELRRRYAAMQSGQSTLGMDSTYDVCVSGHGVNTMRQDVTNSHSFSDLSFCEIPNQSVTFVSPSNSSSSMFNAPNMHDVDKVSSVVNMLKGTLERKKLSYQVDKETLENSSNVLFCAREITGNPSFNPSCDNYIHEIQNTLHELPPVQVKDKRTLQMVEGSADLGFEAFVNSANPIQSGGASQEPSQSESSAAAAVVSSGFEVCDGPSNSTQTHSNGESSRKQVGDSQSLKNGSRSKDFRERIIDNLKDDRKRGSLVRYGSVTSGASVDKGDPTKKRRVERSRKMAEAKERNMTPTIPSDMQSVLKRCENLEKEVRSLKLNLSFMNRKDSEQTKQIEDLQKQNEDLADEKERLLEEIERILSETGRM